jgi:hypothetical protein
METNFDYSTRMMRDHRHEQDSSDNELCSNCMGNGCRHCYYTGFVDITPFEWYDL